MSIWTTIEVIRTVKPFQISWRYAFDRLLEIGCLWSAMHRYEKHPLKMRVTRWRLACTCGHLLRGIGPGSQSKPRYRNLYAMTVGKYYKDNTEETKKVECQVLQSRGIS